ncbi:hypothetical protein [Tenacibaculum finnmarkense]|uniref:hypothetical protein n=1 Tax=Tenacibaculum finnmarkense TaxID=2781243 RepID=UPI00187B8DEB|nr:hypothetical protein [Tenacibaculum finnmarkense]MBE7649255.1 hypothetical protein [Tenacibaculum finnmarkense genomovar ulcerans]
MKLVGIILIAAASIAFTSCNTDQLDDFKDEKIELERRYLRAIDPEKDCPENDRNCNGVPDEKE